jgi:hypothetical protein
LQAKPTTSVGALQDEKLMAEGKDLGLQGSMFSEGRSEGQNQ